MGLKARIWAAKLGGVRTEEKEKKKKKEKFLLCESIGHRPLRGRCPKRRLSQRSEEKWGKERQKDRQKED